MQFIGASGGALGTGVAIAVAVGGPDTTTGVATGIRRSTPDGNCTPVAVSAVYATGGSTDSI